MARKSRKQSVIEAVVSIPEESSLYRTAAYLRLSSDDRRKQGDSLETQRNIIERYIAASPDLQLVDCYTDNDKTGTNFNRPAFQQMIADIESGKINCIVVKDLSRFGRNAIDAGYYLEKYLPAKGVRFISVNDGHDSLTSDGGIMLPIKNILAESYALDIGRKCKAVKWQNIKEGYFVGYHAPYGYKKSPSDCHKLVIDNQTAPVVQDIFLQASSGVSTSEITRELNRRHILTPSQYKKHTGATKHELLVGRENWTRRTVSSILCDQVYIGDMVQGKSKRVGGRLVEIEPSAWIIVKGTHAPLISCEQFDKVQLFKERSRQQEQRMQESATPYSANLFAGKVFCAHCGYAMRRKRQNKDGTYWYRCESQQNYGKRTCTVVSVKEKDLLNVIVVMLHEQNRAMTGHYQSLARINIAGIEDTELITTQQNIAKTKRFIQSLYESLVSDIITSEEYAQMKLDYNEKITLLSQKVGDLQESKRKRKCDLETYRELTEAVEETLKNRELTTMLIERLVERVDVHSDKTATIYLKYRNELQEVG